MTLANKRDNIIQVYQNDNWIYKDKSQVLEDLMDSKYSVIDTHYDKLENMTDWYFKNKSKLLSLLVLIFLPLASFTLVKQLKLDSREKSLENTKSENLNIKQWTRLEVLKDYRFYIISLNMLSLPSIATGVFVYQSFILTSKNWGPFIMAQSFMAYSILSVITLSISGFLIDKYTSRKLLIYMNIPLFISAIILHLFDSPYSSFIFLGLIGISNGFANVLGSSTWAEIYGVKHIGAIKALTTGLMVFATAVGTAVFGILIDAGYTINSIAVFSAIYIAIIVILLFFFRNKIEPTYN